jgi:1-acyl-sn-glycerol-3-phosphate acyltransferase
MTRTIICALLRLALRVFFRRVEINGLDRVPKTGPVIFVLNHPNGLVDPAFILALAPRPVSFLAKSTLFKMPVISYFVKALDSIPVYRKQDTGEDTSKNQETFKISREILKNGGSIALCPEGVSHNEPRLLPLKTGAARIALGAASAGQRDIGLKIMPCGLYYTAKHLFRSSALLYFGEPFDVKPVALDEKSDPPREEVEALTGKIEEELREVVLNAEHDEALQTIERAERVFSSDIEEKDKKELKREFELKQRFIEGYAYHRQHSPERVNALVDRIARYEAELEQIGLDPEELAPPTSLSSIAFYTITRTVLFALLLPLTVVGIVVNYPAYISIKYIAIKLSNNYNDIVSTIKIIASALLFPLTWIALASLCYWLMDWRLALASLIIGPIAGYVTIRITEEFNRFIAGTLALGFFITRKGFFKRLLVERRAIRKEILALGNEAFQAQVEKA